MDGRGVDSMLIKSSQRNVPAIGQANFGGAARAPGRIAVMLCLPLVLVLAIVMLTYPAGATHPDPGIGPLPAAYLSEEAEWLNFTVYNPSQQTGRLPDRVLNVKFTPGAGTVSATSAKVLQPDGVTVDPNWAPSVAASTLTFNSTIPGQGLPSGGQRIFRVPFTPPAHVGDGTDNWTIASTAILAGEHDQTNSTATTVKVVGVRFLSLGGPPGTLDRAWSANQTLRINVSLANHGTLPANGLTVKVNTTDGGAPSNESVVLTGVNLAVGNTLQEFTLLTRYTGTQIRFSNLTASITAGWPNPVSRTTTSAPTPDALPLPLNISQRATFAPHASVTFTNSTRWISSDLAAPNRTAFVNVSWQNLGIADASNLNLNLDMLDANGDNVTNHFTITPTTPTSFATAVFGVRQTTAFTVTPTTATDGGYHPRLNFTFNDANNDTFPLTPIVHSNRTNATNLHPNGFIVVDSTKPSADYSGATPTFNDRFERGGFNRVDFTIAASDAPFAVNASRVVLEISPQRAPPSTAPYANRCSGVPLVCRDIMTQGATQGDGSILFTNTTDFSQFEVRGTFNVKTVVTDNAGNSRTTAVLPIVLTDNLAPDITNVADSTATGTAFQTTPIRFSATVNDNYRVGANLTGEQNALGNGVFLKLFDANNVVIDLTSVCAGYGADGCPMAFQGASNLFSRNGTYAVTTTVPHTGNITYKVFARDPSFNAVGGRNFANAAGSRAITINSAVTAFFRGSDGNHPDAIYSSASLHPAANQLQPVRFGTLNLSAGTLPQDFQLIVRNEAGGLDTFVFECQVLSTSTLSEVPTVGGCEINNTLSADTSVPLNKNNTVTISVKNGTVSPPPPFSNTPIPLGGAAPGMALTDQEERPLSLNVTVPPSARPGEVGRIQFIVKSRFVPSAQANVTLGFFVNEVRGTEFRHASFTTPSATVDIKPSRTILVPFLLRNPGNIALRYNVTLPAPDLPAGWSFAWESTDSRFNAVGRNITLSPAGTTGDANTTILRARITAPASAPIGTLPVRTLLGQGDGVPDVSFALTLNVLQPTLTTPTAGPVFIQVGPTPTQWDIANNTQAPCPTSTCTYKAGNQVNITLRSVLQSTRNPTNPNAAGQIQPYALVQYPDGSVQNGTAQSLLMTLTRLITGQACPTAPPDPPCLAGKDGTYEATFTVLDQPARLNFSLYATDNLDQVFSNPNFDDPAAFFDVREDPPLGQTLATLWRPSPCSASRCDVPEVRDEGTLLTPDSSNRFLGSFGDNITVKVNLADNKHIGRLDLRIERVLPDGTILFVQTTRMTKLQNTETVGQRILNATFQGTFQATGSFAINAGDYQFSLLGIDAVGNPSIVNTTSVFTVRLVDATGPVFRSVELTGGGRAANATILDVELGSGASLVAVVTDNADLAPGSNVDASTVRATLLSETGTSLLNTTFTRSASDPTRFTLDIPASTLAAPGNYSLELRACDLTGNCAPVVLRTLRVLRNAAPELVVASPPETAGVRWAGPAAPIVVNVNDLNTDLTVPGRVLVEVTLASTNATTTVTATPGGAVPSQTLTIPTPSGDASIHVVVTDALNATSEPLRFSVRVDATPPAGVVVSVDPDDRTTSTAVGKAFQASAGESFTLAPDARLFIAAQDSGSGVASVTVRATVEGGATANFTLGASEPFRLSERFPGLASGRVTISATATDRAGNSASTTAPATVVIDATPPVIGAVTPASPLSVRATDAGAGVFGVRVEWSDSPTATRTSFDLAASGDTWSAEFPPEASGTVFFVVIGTDKVGNEATQDCSGQPCRLDLGNRPPVFRAGSVKVEPLTGGVARGVVNVTWDVASSPPGAPVTVALRLSGAASRELNASATSPFRWDTTTVPDGTYTLTLEASDGTQKSTQTLTVRVQNLVAKAPPGTPTAVPAGGSITVPFDPASTGKEVRSVNAIFRPAGGSPETVPMTKQANGQWSVTYTPKLKASYTVDLAVTFADNTTSTVQNYHAFSAEGQPAGTNIVPLLPVLLVALLVIALGAVGLRRF